MTTALSPLKASHNIASLMHEMSTQLLGPFRLFGRDMSGLPGGCRLWDVHAAKLEERGAKRVRTHTQ